MSFSEDDDEDDDDDDEDDEDCLKQLLTNPSSTRQNLIPLPGPQNMISANTFSRIALSPLAPMPPPPSLPFPFPFPEGEIALSAIACKAPVENFNCIPYV